jgi:hypothetical protein
MDEGDHAGHHRSGRSKVNVEEADGVIEGTPTPCGACSARSGWRPSCRRTVPSPRRDPPSIPASTPSRRRPSLRADPWEPVLTYVLEAVPARSGPFSAGTARVITSRSGRPPR